MANKLDVAGKPITKVASSSQQREEIDATATPAHDQAGGMQIKLGPPTHEKPSYSQHDPTFTAFRFQAQVAGTVIPLRVPNIPKYYCVRINPETAAGGLCRIQAGSFDVTLAVLQAVKFPARTDLVTLTIAGAATDISVAALGDDELRFI